MALENNLSTLYQQRFQPEEQTGKNAIWRVLCSAFFQRYVTSDDSVLDLACGYGEFINNIHCRRKFAVDLNEDSSRHVDDDVAFFLCPSTDLADLADASIDVVFVSNFFEHLPCKQDILKTLNEVNRVLKTAGRLMILQPNIRFLPGAYWDFFDHHLPLTDHSMVEALNLTGFTVDNVLPRFLPYTTKGRIPKHPVLVRLYLHVPPVWKIMGGQMFILAHKP